MRNYPTAEEARIQAEKNISEADQIQIDEIFEKIDGAVKEGKLEVTGYFHVRKKVIETLKILGYIFEDQGNQIDGSQFKISW